jgi:cellulose synthase/poly-beta-1,6-N-acetylglucosamine synthase-like glycosyltransferase
MSRRFSLTVNAAMAALVLLLLPVVHAALLGVNLIVHLFVLGLQVVMTRMHRERSGPLGSVGSQEPFVSIIVPSHNEPPEILIATLRCLAKIRWSKFEVLVVDNNTSDKGLWEPVQSECQRLGPKRIYEQNSSSSWMPIIR